MNLSFSINPLKRNLFYSSAKSKKLNASKSSQKIIQKNRLVFNSHTTSANLFTPKLITKDAVNRLGESFLDNPRGIPYSFGIEECINSDAQIALSEELIQKLKDSGFSLDQPLFYFFSSSPGKSKNGFAFNLTSPLGGRLSLRTPAGSIPVVKDSKNFKAHHGITGELSTVYLDETPIMKIGGINNDTYFFHPDTLYSKVNAILGSERGAQELIKAFSKSSGRKKPPVDSVVSTLIRASRLSGQTDVEFKLPLDIVEKLPIFIKSSTGSITFEPSEARETFGGVQVLEVNFVKGGFLEVISPRDIECVHRSLQGEIIVKIKKGEKRLLPPGNLYLDDQNDSGKIAYVSSQPDRLTGQTLVKLNLIKRESYIPHQQIAVEREKFFGLYDATKKIATFPQFLQLFLAGAGHKDRNGFHRAMVKSSDPKNPHQTGIVVFNADDLRKLPPDSIIYVYRPSIISKDFEWSALDPERIDSRDLFLIEGKGSYNVGEQEYSTFARGVNNNGQSLLLMSRIRRNEAGGLIKTLEHVTVKNKRHYSAGDRIIFSTEFSLTTTGRYKWRETSGELFPLERVKHGAKHPLFVSPPPRPGRQALNNFEEAPKVNFSITPWVTEEGEKQILLDIKPGDGQLVIIRKDKEQENVIFRSSGYSYEEHTLKFEDGDTIYFVRSSQEINLEPSQFIPICTIRNSDLKPLANSSHITDYGTELPLYRNPVIELDILSQVL